MSKKERLVRFLEKRRIVAFNELLQLLGSVNTTKHYVMELKEFGVLKYRDVLRLNGKQVVVYFISHKGLEAYKEELKRRREKKVELARRLYKSRRRSSS